MAKTLLNVTGMKCGGCEATVNAKVGELEGVSNVKANHREKTVEVEFDEAKIDVEAVKQVIVANGFQVI